MSNKNDFLCSFVLFLLFHFAVFTAIKVWQLQLPSTDTLLPAPAGFSTTGCNDDLVYNKLHLTESLLHQSMFCFLGACLVFAISHLLMDKIRNAPLLYFLILTSIITIYVIYCNLASISIISGLHS